MKNLFVAFVLACCAVGCANYDIDGRALTETPDGGLECPAAPECPKQEECPTPQECPTDICSQEGYTCQGPQECPTDVCSTEGYTCRGEPEECPVDVCSQEGYSCQGTPEECPTNVCAQDGYACRPEPEQCPTCPTDTCSTEGYACRPSPEECPNPNPVCPEGQTCKAEETCPDDDSQWVTLCHLPPGNPANAHTIKVGASAVPAHLAHGDTLGPCNCSHNE